MRGRNGKPSGQGDHPSQIGKRWQLGALDGHAGNLERGADGAEREQARRHRLLLLAFIIGISDHAPCARLKQPRLERLREWAARRRAATRLRDAHDDRLADRPWLRSVGIRLQLLSRGSLWLIGAEGDTTAHEEVDGVLGSAAQERRS